MEFSRIRIAKSQGTEEEMYEAWICIFPVKYGIESTSFPFYFAKIWDYMKEVES